LKNINDFPLIKNPVRKTWAHSGLWQGLDNTLNFSTMRIVHALGIFALC